MEEHGSRRDRLEDVYKTRGEVPEDDISLNGICDINISYNKLNSLFIKDLVYFLQHDGWLKSFNLRGNEIDSMGI